MAQRRGHGHGRQREAGGHAAVNNPLTKPALERRVVTIYTTLTSSGWTGGDLTTIFPSSTSIGKAESTSDTKTTSSDTLSTQKSIAQQAAADSSVSSSSKTSLAPIEASTASTDMGTGALVAATADSTTSSTMASSTAKSTSTTATSASGTSSASATSSATSSGGSNDVAVKAGVALGVLGGLLVVLGLVYFMITRRRKQVEEQQRRAADDEKLNSPFDDAPAPAAPAKAPRLSLRPITGLFTNFNPSAAGEQRAAKSPPMVMRAPGTSAWERPMTSDSQNERNPFGSNAETIPEDPSTPHNPMSPMTPISEVSTHGASPEYAAGLAPAPRAISALTADSTNVPRISAITMDSATVPAILTKNLPVTPTGSADVSPVESADGFPVGQAITTPEPIQAATFSSNAPAAASSLSAIERRPSERRQSVRKENVPAPLDLTLPPKFSAVPPSPANTEFSMQEVDPDHSPVPSASAAAIAAAGGPANSTVHRVQLDFKPTLDDEMGLQAGQLVRLLHEYDDGWALCIRLDRSQQGVVPRTCLSTRPVKPRTPPQGGPRGPPGNPRPVGPPASSQRGPGPACPPGGQPRPLGPAGQRRPVGPPTGPGMAQGARPQSPNGPARKPGPQGPSNRQQEYRPSNNGQSQSPITRKPAPGQAY